MTQPLVDHIVVGIPEGLPVVGLCDHDHVVLIGMPKTLILYNLFFHFTRNICTMMETFGFFNPLNRGSF